MKILALATLLLAFLLSLHQLQTSEEKRQHTLQQLENMRSSVHSLEQELMKRDALLLEHQKNQETLQHAHREAKRKVVHALTHDENSRHWGASRVPDGFIGLF